jgi:uncharacterized membrane protein
MKHKRILGLILALVGLLYPLLIYFEVNVYFSRTLALLIGLSFAGNFLAQRRRVNQGRFLILCCLMFLIYAAVIFISSSLFVVYLPFLISISLLSSFVYSLLYPPNAIELFARALVPDLSSAEVIYCRHVTLIWIVFFLLNGITAFYTACCASLGAWTLYNGLVAYVVMGVLFAMELGYRSWRFRRYVGLPTDVIFKKLFPPRA